MELGSALIAITGGFFGAVLGSMAVSAEVTVRAGMELCGPVGAVVGGIAYAMLVRHHHQQADGQYLWDRGSVLGVVIGAAIGAGLAGTRKFFSPGPQPEDRTESKDVMPPSSEDKKTDQLDDKGTTVIDTDEGRDHQSINDETLDKLPDANQERKETDDMVKNRPCEEVLNTHWKDLEAFLQRIKELIKTGPEDEDLVNDRYSRLKRIQDKMVLYLEMEGLLESLIHHHQASLDEDPIGPGRLLVSSTATQEQHLVFDEELRYFFTNIPAQLGRRPLRERLMECLIYRIRCPQHADFHHVGQHNGTITNRSDLLVMKDGKNLMVDHALFHHPGEPFDRIFQMDLLRSFADHKPIIDEDGQKRVQRSWENFYKWIYESKT